MGVSPWMNIKAKIGTNWFQNLALIGSPISELHVENIQQYI
jgi:hypothetical protein